MIDIISKGRTFQVSDCFVHGWFCPEWNCYFQKNDVSIVKHEDLKVRLETLKTMVDSELTKLNTQSELDISDSLVLIEDTATECIEIYKKMDDQD